MSASLELGRAEAVARAVAVHLAEEHLRSSPFHGIWANLSTVAISSGGQPAVDLLVHHHDRQAFARRLAPAERALAERVAAVDRACGPCPCGSGSTVEVAARVDRAAAPGAVRRAGTASRRAPLAGSRIAARLLDRLGGVARSGWAWCAGRPTGRCGRARRPSGVAAAESSRRITSQAQMQRRGPLELLERQQPQRVAHQHGHARARPTGPSTVALQAAEGHACRRSGPGRPRSCRRRWGTRAGRRRPPGRRLRSGW